MSTRTTPYYKFPLYDPEAAPDLTETGEHDAAIQAIDTALHGEAVARVDKDLELAGKINDEANERKAADAAEKAARESADTKLTNGLAKEVTDRTNADTAITERVDALDSRETADKAALEEKIEAAKTNNIAPRKVQYAPSAVDSTDPDGTATAIGNRSYAHHKNSVALGYGSETDRAYSVAVGSPNFNLNRTITSVADPTEPHDAATKNYVDTTNAALSKRIDNAEVEISANSADLTGIKGLTYRDKNVFVENSNGEYDSPALIEIAHEIDKSPVTRAVDLTGLPNLRGKFGRVYDTVSNYGSQLYSMGTSYTTTPVPDQLFCINSDDGKQFRVSFYIWNYDTSTYEEHYFDFNADDVGKIYTLPKANDTSLGGIKIDTISSDSSLCNIGLDGNGHFKIDLRPLTRDSKTIINTSTIELPGNGYLVNQLEVNVSPAGGIKVDDTDGLYVDWSKAPTGITANTAWSELESALS